MSALDKMKTGLFAAGDASKRAALRGKITTELTLLKQKISSAKKDFGVKVYDAMAQANKAEVERLFTEARAKIEALEAEMAAKHEKYLSLKEPGTPRQSSVGAPPPGMPAAPPPGAPPPAGPPPGWRVTTTSEGKEYYYNENTGETSWTLPPMPVS